MIFAIKDKETVYLASTFTPISGCIGKEDKALPENAAIFNIPDSDVFLAIEKSTIPFVDKLRFTPLFEGTDGKLTASNLINHVKPRIVELATEYDVYKKGYFYCDLIFVQGDKIITMNGNGCLADVNDYIVFGNGEDSATGSLAITSELPAEDRIIRAVHAVRDNDHAIYYPITIVDTAADEGTVISEGTV